MKHRPIDSRSSDQPTAEQAFGRIEGEGRGLRDYYVPREDMPKLKHGIAERPGAKANPRRPLRQ